MIKLYQEIWICDDCGHEYFADRMYHIIREDKNGNPQRAILCPGCIAENDTYGQ